MKDHEVEADKILRKYILLLLELEGICMRCCFFVFTRPHSSITFSG